MRIGIEADRMQANRFGIGRFAREIVQALQCEFPQHTYGLFRCAKPPRRFYRSWSPVRLARGIRRSVWLQAVLPRQLGRWRADVAFFPDYIVSFTSPCPVVAVMHDLLFLQRPQWGEPLVNQQLRICVPLTVHRADALVVPSEWVKGKLITAYRCQPERVTVVPEGVSASFHPVAASEVDALRIRYGLSGIPYVLSVGMWTPRKNLLRLLEAFASIDAASSGKLVLVGGGGWSEEPLRRAVKALHIEHRVALIGFVPEEHLPALYSGATAFAFPSLYEGFGLPVLEAMACGCPVVASNATAIPEVTGDAAVLVEPQDTGAWAEALRRVVGDPALRARLRDAGLHRAAAFTWAQAARRLEAIFQACVR